MASTRPEPGTFAALLSAADREALAGLGGTRAFATGERLMHQGEPGDRVVVLLEGHVKASHVDVRGREVVLSFRGPGDVLGELTFTHGEPRSASTTAIEPVSAQVLTSAAFRGFLVQQPTAALTLIDVISRRFRYANDARVQFGDLDTSGRLAARLLELADRYGDPVADGIRIRLPVTQADLGSWTASSRAGVAEALRSMREQGWITTERRRITLLDVEALTRRTG
ncbi:Crp/Fnr family transcriptional regulator [Nocardioides marmoriginsengisoli]|uniref:Crp/Fnr family transcriptional regulator n=1 Tax=Nocardioides marmoriginsengisoli TaxID=661483 RepID=A0A3N0CAR9_9ACTN|nr:Crp/Fnr family transcriptional regulator [Nocardioides marmoriginsengisoli]RNL60564.1 Crp/Fnr family transcriptional regulator [Nocardioides marmoriginsengisoli]